MDIQLYVRIAFVTKPVSTTIERKRPDVLDCSDRINVYPSISILDVMRHQKQHSTPQPSPSFSILPFIKLARPINTVPPSVHFRCWC